MGTDGCLEPATPEGLLTIDNESVTGRIHNTDVRKFLDRIPDSTADLIFVDPPFNLGKVYTTGLSLDRRSDDEYRSWLLDLLDRVGGQTA